MSHYYLVSSLPHVALEGALPFGRQEFGAMCAGVLAEDELADIHLLLGLADEPAKTAVVKRWLSLEARLTQEIAKSRAEKLGTDFKMLQGFSGVVEPGVSHAFSASNPGERELELDTFRWSLLDNVAAEEPYGFAAVVAFAVKLSLAERWSVLDDQEGEAKLEKLIAESAKLDF